MHAEAARAIHFLREMGCASATRLDAGTGGSVVATGTSPLPRQTEHRDPRVLVPRPMHIGQRWRVGIRCRFMTALLHGEQRSSLDFAYKG